MKKHILSLSLLAVLAFLIGCQKEFSRENGNTPSEGSLQSDTGGDCLPKTVAGIYEAGTALNGTNNYIEVQVDVTTPGSYVVYTDTVNGVYFRSVGVFTTTGLNTIRLKGTGTPVSSGINNYIVAYGSSQCTVAVTTLPAGAGGPAVFALDGSPTTCNAFVLAGTYVQGSVLGASNTVTININVTTIGTYNITTALNNGFKFTGSGPLLTTGPQTITLTAVGTPTASGTTNVAITAGTSSCSFPVIVIGAATYTIDCGSAIPNGTFTQGEALDNSNTISITVNVAVVGGYNITGSVNGMTFTGTGTFAGTGDQTIALQGTGQPTAEGSFTVPLTGGTAGCSFPIDVDPGAGGGGGAAGTWSFKVGTTVFSGPVLVAFEVTNAGLTAFTIGGSATTGPADGAIQIGLSNTPSGPVTTGTYSGSALTGKIAIFSYSENSLATAWAGLPGLGSNLSVNLTTYTAHSAIGTFSGSVKDQNTMATVNITNGVFNATF